jgi:hypothetical protein
MWSRLVVIGAFLAVVGACQQSAGQSGAVPNPASPSTAAAASPARPWKANITWKVTGIEWAGQPGTAKSLFGGRCSVESDYLITGTFEGEATHVGHLAGQVSHCSQIAWTPQGPGSSTYSDGRGSLTAANGDTLTLTYGHGAAGYDAAVAEFWFKDDFTFTGGTGRFARATGGGSEGGRFKDFMALLAGAPAAMTMAGTIAY